MFRHEMTAALASNEVIEVYEREGRVRYVLFSEPGDRPLHVVVADDDILAATVILSVYEPDEDHGWDAATGFRARKGPYHER